MMSTHNIHQVRTMSAERCGLYAACSRAKSAGRGAYGGPWYEHSASYLQPICVRDRILIRADNQITAGRERGNLRIEMLAADTRSKYTRLLQGYGDLAKWAGTPIPPEASASLFGHRSPKRHASF